MKGRRYFRSFLLYLKIQEKQYRNFPVPFLFSRRWCKAPAVLQKAWANTQSIILQQAGKHCIIELKLFKRYVPMWFWIFMFLMDLLVPLTMICFGLRFEKNPPKEINFTFGYRTAMSMKNQETWKFAHQYIGKLWRRCGYLISAISVIIMLFLLGKDIIRVSVTGGIVCVVQIVVMICTIIPTEFALKKRFDPYGNPI